jgi:hypothetical protein
MQLPAVWCACPRCEWSCRQSIRTFHPAIHGCLHNPCREMKQRHVPLPHRSPCHVSSSLLGRHADTSSTLAPTCPPHQATRTPLVSRKPDRRIILGSSKSPASLRNSMSLAVLRSRALAGMEAASRQRRSALGQRPAKSDHGRAVIALAGKASSPVAIRCPYS